MARARRSRDSTFGIVSERQILKGRSHPEISAKAIEIAEQFWRPIRADLTQQLNPENRDFTFRNINLS